MYFSMSCKWSKNLTYFKSYCFTNWVHLWWYELFAVKDKVDYEINGIVDKWLAQPLCFYNYDILDEIPFFPGVVWAGLPKMVQYVILHFLNLLRLCSPFIFCYSIVFLWIYLIRNFDLLKAVWVFLFPSNKAAALNLVLFLAVSGNIWNNREDWSDKRESFWLASISKYICDIPP